MYHSPVIIAAISVFASLAGAHGHGAPHILGLDAADLRAREILTRFGPQVKDTEHSHIKFTLESRADKPQCGPGIGSCGDGSCCSDHGCMISDLAKKTDNVLILCSLWYDARLL